MNFRPINMLIDESYTQWAIHYDIITVISQIMKCEDTDRIDNCGVPKHTELRGSLWIFQQRKGEKTLLEDYMDFRVHVVQGLLRDMIKEYKNRSVLG